MKNWYHIGSVGVSIVDANEETLDCFNVAQCTLFGKKISLVWIR